MHPHREYATWRWGRSWSDIFDKDIWKTRTICAGNHQKPRREKEGFFPNLWREHGPADTLVSNIKKCGRKNICFLKVLSLWQIITVVLGNECKSQLKFQDAFLEKLIRCFWTSYGHSKDLNYLTELWKTWTKLEGKHYQNIDFKYHMIQPFCS